MPLLPGDKRRYTVLNVHPLSRAAVHVGDIRHGSARLDATKTNGRMNAPGNLRKMNLIS